MRFGCNLLPEKAIPEDFLRVREFNTPLSAYKVKYVYDASPASIYSFIADLIVEEKDFDFLIGDDDAHKVLLHENGKSFLVEEDFMLYFLAGLYAAEGYDSIKYKGQVVSEGSFDQELCDLFEYYKEFEEMNSDDEFEEKDNNEEVR